LVAVDAGACAAAVFVPLVWRLAAARLAGARFVAVRFVAVDFVAVALAALLFVVDFFFAAGFRGVDFAVAPVLAGLLLPLVRGWATAPLLLHDS
jgi:hypothetical protein